MEDKEYKKMLNESEATDEYRDWIIFAYEEASRISIDLTEIHPTEYNKIFDMVFVDMLQKFEGKIKKENKR